ncbi:glycoside hydrolase family 20 protein [Amniculibacterium aquaticum]|uniref:glycoside hydrolase family 20 protein n=1 Tax=Amniculibacterium aquaticum TaxID=2479858 RepID=UPI000F5B180B|nr:family 20 glycosylhydrolase [Amniculibacterium aquaticum]
MIRYLFILMVFVFQNLYSQNELIPQPKSLILEKGELKFGENWLINAKEFPKEAQYLEDFLKQNFKFNVEQTSFSANGIPNVVLKSNTKLKEDFYTLTVGKTVVIEARDGKGIFYGIQTLIQLIHENLSKGQMQYLKIEDRPDFQWRGMHLDCSRHFFSKDFVKKYIDFIAMYKMNTFHWHLTDDQGWRIEIKKYPKLTEVGAWRNGSMIGAYSEQKFDNERYGGYYTQEEIKEIVKYAADRHVNIVPEIEMPGHAVAAIASYPELGCTGKQIPVENKWGVFENVFCPKEETFKFLEDVLTEVIALFPSKTIHIGGDECPKENWKKCAHCQELIKKFNLKDEHGLQSYFIQRIEKFLNGKGREIIGWDEILEGGLAPNAAVMSWRGFEGGIEAAKQKHNVVMTPGDFCYFDHYQGDAKNEPLAFGGNTTVEKVYSFNPIPKELKEDEKKYILGAQANLWTEYILDSKHVEYMVFPRIAALSEVLWGKKSSYDEFQKRLFRHFSLLQLLGINYSKSIFEVTGKSLVNETGNPVVFALKGFDGAHGIYYTLDGSEPNLNSIKYISPFPINKSSTVQAAYFENGKIKSKVFSQKIKVSKSTGKKVVLENEPSEKYFGIGAQTLTDGIEGVAAKFRNDWLGFTGKDAVATIDFGGKTNFSTVKTNFVKSNENWIHLPQSVQLFVSDDGIHFNKIKEIPNADIVKANGQLNINIGNQNARFIKMLATNTTKIPDGFAGAGYPAWLFVDEVSVD